MAGNGAPRSGVQAVADGRTEQWFAGLRASQVRRAGLLLAVLLGALLGVGGFTFHYAEGLSYAGTAPEVCANCHLMQPRYDSWQHSSHHGVATCVDCHLPHALLPKYIAKGLNGYHHSKAFTLQNFKEPVEIKPGNSRILQESCLRCHGDLVETMSAAAAASPAAVRCVHCHSGVGHGEPVGLGGPDRGERAERSQR
jgi:cytochrome c nitrite reductase small subunit